MGRYNKLYLSENKEFKFGNINNLNFLTVNYLQRKAIVDGNKKILEDVTNAIKEIKKIIIEETEYAPTFFPPTQVIPEFYVDLFDSEFMSLLCNPLSKYKKFDEKNDKKIKYTPDEYLLFKKLIGFISKYGKYGSDYFKNYHRTALDHKMVDKICFLLFNNEIDMVIDKLKNDPESEKYCLQIVRDFSVSTSLKIYEENRNDIIHFDSINDPFVISKRRKIKDILKMNENYELIQKFSGIYGNYDAYSLTAYFDIDYYISMFASVIKYKDQKKKRF